MDYPITEGYYIVYYTKEIMPFSPTIRHQRLFTTKEGADTFMRKIVTEKGLPEPVCKTIYTVTINGDVYVKIDPELIDSQMV